MIETIINETQRIYSHLDGVESAAFSFWLLCVACFYGTLCYLSYLALAYLFQKIWPKKINGLNPKNRF
jgi:hypothetical protein